MPGLTDDQIAAARSVDLLTYLQSCEPGSIRKSGPGEYCLVEHDSLKITQENGKWYWFSRGFGGSLSSLATLYIMPFHTSLFLSSPLLSVIIPRFSCKLLKYVSADGQVGQRLLVESSPAWWYD